MIFGALSGDAGEELVCGDYSPVGDTGVARNLRNVFGFARGREEQRARRLVGRLGPNRGMLYYHLLLSRLEAMSETPLRERARGVIRAGPPEAVRTRRHPAG